MITDDDKKWARAMIDHHKKAVQMADMYIKEGDNEKLLDLCEKIISVQTKEIDFLRKLLGK